MSDQKVKRDETASAQESAAGVQRDSRPRWVTAAAAKRRLKLTDERGLSVDVPFGEQSSLISPSGRAAIRIAGELLRTKRKQRGAAMTTEAEMWSVLGR